MLTSCRRCPFAFSFLAIAIAPVPGAFAAAAVGREGPGEGRASEADPRIEIPGRPSPNFRFELSARASGSGVAIDRVERGGADEPPPPASDLPLRSLIRTCLDIRILYQERPSYIDEPVDRPGIEMEPVPDGPRMGAVKQLLEKEFFRQVRSRLKRDWRRQLREMPTMSYSRYEEMLFQINEIGREDFSGEMAESEYYTGKLRGDVFRRYPEGELEIPVLKLGPIMLMDSGSLNIDASSFSKALGGEDDHPFEVGPETRRSLISGKGYRIHTRFRLDFNPLKGFSRGDPMDSFGSFGLVLDVVWLSDILRQERFQTECEAEYDRDGELALFFNFVLRSW
jgi:hypothetical protein